jgi:hypothetical protein
MYTISAGYLTSALAAREDLRHATVADALAALARLVPGMAQGSDLVTYRGDDGRCYVYACAADMADDVDGSSALAVVEPVGCGDYDHAGNYRCDACLSCSCCGPGNGCEQV